MHDTLIIIVSLIFSAFFSGMEIAFLSSNKLRLEIDRRHNTFPSKIIAIFSRVPSKYIASMLVGNNIALVLYGIAVGRILHNPIQTALSIESEAAVLVIQTIISTLFILLTAEFLPKMLFRINPNAVLNILALPTLILYVILYPITLLTIWISNFTMKHLFRVDVEYEGAQPVFSKVDLSHLVMEGNTEQHEAIETEHDLKIFKNALEFSTLKVRDCLIPRTEMVAVEIESPVTDLIQKFSDSGLSRIFVYRESIDNVIGYVNSKDMFRQPDHIGKFLKSVPIIPETLPVNKLLRTFIREGKNIALVVDEYGGTSGLITSEDIIEEIFGEIEDEHDTTDLIEKQLSDNSYRFSGRLEIDYLNEKYGLDLPEAEDYDTLAGFVIYHHSSIPEVNTTLWIEPFEVRIIKVSANRIDLIELIDHKR
ncbi:MAG: hemolysin family protein [Bacteroidota bacterium]